MPRSYQFRGAGLNPVVPGMFGYSRTVHTSIQKLRVHPDTAGGEPSGAGCLENIHLKHVPKRRSGRPTGRLREFEIGRWKSQGLRRVLRRGFSADRLKRYLRFRPNCIITGSLISCSTRMTMKHPQAEIIDFKTMEGGETPGGNDDLDGQSLLYRFNCAERDKVLGR